MNEKLIGDIVLNKNKYTLSQVEEIIDSHIQNDTNFLFVCDFALAHYIYDYLDDSYGIKPESLELSKEVDEYYVSLQFYNDNKFTLVCEYASWNQGKYKYDDVDKNNYYVFTDMSFGDARYFLLGKGDFQFCELVYVNKDEEVITENKNNQYDVCDECSQCIGCDEHCGRGNHNEEFSDEELSDEDEEIIKLIEKYASNIENENLCECGCELRNILFELFDVGRNIGFGDAKDQVREFLDG
jgi:hypothetical protein